jgi:hypothetical protein
MSQVSRVLGAPVGGEMKSALHTDNKKEDAKNTRQPARIDDIRKNRPGSMQQSGRSGCLDNLGSP